MPTEPRPPVSRRKLGIFGVVALISLLPLPWRQIGSALGL